MTKLALILVVFSFLLSNQAIAQDSEEGTPLSMDPTYSSEMAVQSYVPLQSLPAPDVTSLKNEDRINALTSDLCRVGALVDADIDIQNSGSLITLSDGRKVWRMKIQVPGLQAIGLYYDKFQLPAGVKYYLYNAAKTQILGAYTNIENPDDGIWANEKVQGDVVNLEMDFDNDVDISQVQLHINKVGAFYKVSQYFSQGWLPQSGYKTTVPGFNTSSGCEINAACSTSVSSFVNQCNATVVIDYIRGPFIYSGSGTMMNNTAQDCTPYVLTASHVEPSNSTSNITFSNWVFYYNYQAPTCVYSGSKPSYKTMTGATFVARASYDSSSPSIKGDFLLVKLKAKPAHTYGYYMAGWDTSDAVLPVSGTYICYHHPNADIKKVSTATSASPLGNFNGGAAKSHWQVAWSQGGQEEGSSGSGLFNANGRLVGILSGGNTNSSCTDTNSMGMRMTTLAEFSKLAVDWSYKYQSPSSSTSRLKDWLDPTHSNVSSLDGTTSCLTAVPQTVFTIKDIKVYPVPSNGTVYIDNYSGNSSDIQVMDIMGNVVHVAIIKTNTSSKYQLDLSNYPTGIYLLRFTQGNTSVSKKLILTR